MNSVGSASMPAERLTIGTDASEFGSSGYGVLVRTCRVWSSTTTVSAIFAVRRL